MSKKNIVIFCLIVAGVFLYWTTSQFAEEILGWLNVPVTGKTLWQATSQQDYLSWIYANVPAVLITVLVLFLIYRSERSMTFFTESVGELQKVTHPLPKEAGQSAIVVVVIVLICVAVLGLYDVIWQRVILFML